jgi:uncharacterized protein
MPHPAHELPPTTVDVSALLDQAGATRQVRLDVPVPAGFAVPLTDFRGEPDAEVRVEGVLESLLEGILLRGEVAVHVAQQCALCLADLAPREVVAEVAELFDDPAQAADPTDLEPGYLIHDAQIDVDALVRDALAQAIPDAPRCRPDCAGLCPSCGIDRNAGDCTCDDQVADARWAALADLDINP